MMNYRQLEIFREVAIQENFTKAAKQLFMTQSAVSHSMNDLENEAGSQLIERLHRGVRLTPAGKLLLQESIPILENFERLANHLPQLVQELPLRIGSCMTYAKNDLPNLISNLKKQNINCRVTVGPAAEIAKQLEQGKIDLAFLEGNIREQNFQVKQVSKYPIGFFTSPSLAKNLPKLLSLKKILEEPLLLRERGSAVREALEASVTLENLTLRPTWESNDSEALIEAAIAGIGIAVLPKVLIADELAKQTLVEVKIKTLHLENPVLTTIRTSTEIPQILKLWEEL